MNRHLLLGLLLVLILSQGCRKKPVPLASATPMPGANITLAQPVDFRYLSSRAKVQYEGGGEKMSSAINLRIHKDSAIWVSVVPALGIEAVRALFTPDSVKIINRLQKTYIATNYRYLKQAFNIDADFNTLQALLVGNQPYGFTPDLKVMQTTPELHTQQMQGTMRVNNFIDLSTLKLKKIQLADSEAKNSLAVTYADFAALDNFVFPYSAIFLAQQQTSQPPKSIVLTINHNKVSISEPSLSFPFQVPSGYSRQR